MSELPRPYYADDAVTLYHADCRDILPLLPAGSVDLVLTDPPYSAHIMGADARTYVGGPFELGPSEYAAWVKTWWPLLGTERIVLTPGIGQMCAYPQPKWALCWHKPSAVGFNRLGGYNAWEPIYVYGKAVERIGQDYYRLDPKNFLHEPQKEHPCPKPIELMRWLCEKFSAAGETILDPFAGSGTTGRAAKDMGRKAILIESEEQYCEIAARRMSQSVMSLHSQDITPCSDRLHKDYRAKLPKEEKP